MLRSILLKTDKFEGGIKYADNLALATTTSTTAVEIVQVTDVWIDGYDYLVVANGTLSNSLSSANSMTRIQVQVGGTNYGPELRSIPHATPDKFHPCGGLISFVFRGTGASWKVAMNYWVSGSSAGTAGIADAAIAVIPLRRAT